MRYLVFIFALFVALGSCKKSSTPVPEKKPDTVVVKPEPIKLSVSLSRMPQTVDYGYPSTITVGTNLKDSTPVSIMANGKVLATGYANSKDLKVIFNTDPLRENFVYQVVYPGGSKTDTIKVREIEQPLKYLFDGKWSLRKTKGKTQGSNDPWNEGEVTEPCMLDNYRVYGIDKILKSFDGEIPCPYNVDLNTFYRYYFKSDGNLYFLHGEVQEVKVVSVTAKELIIYRLDPSSNGTFVEVFATYVNIAQ